MLLSSEAAVSQAKSAPRRREHPRITLRSLAYVNLEQGNGGIIRDLTESGIAIQSVAPLRPGQEVHLRFDLLSPRVRIDSLGHVTWADSTGQGGIQLSGLSQRMRQALKDWLFTQMLSAANLSGRDSIFAHTDTHLALSPAVRPIILLPEEKTPDVAASVRWGVFSFSQRSFAIFVDTLVLACAALLFSISSIAVMGGFPVWPLSTALFLTSTTIFIAVYQLLFSDLLCGATPGRRLASFATRLPAEDSVQRFR